MINIEYIEELDENLLEILDDEFNKYAIKSDVKCNYMSFNFIAKNNSNDEAVGIIRGHSYYKEVSIDDLIIREAYRNQNIGSSLVKKVEEYYKDKDFDYIAVTTHNFQAPEFYKKCGYEVEFIRENKSNPKLSKYFLIKYLK